MSGELQPITTYASGSVGDTVHSRNAHGPYTRARATPTNPNTNRQVRARRRWAEVAHRWCTVLTNAQRTGWNEYARDRFASSDRPRVQMLSGQQEYQRANYSRQYRMLGFVDDAPLTFRQPQWNVPWDVTNPAGGYVFFRINTADEWANTDLSGMILFCSAVYGSTINFFNGPWRRAKIVRGYEATPPAEYNWFADPWGTATGARRWLRTYVFTGDGRVSESRRQPFDDNT